MTFSLIVITLTVGVIYNFFFEYKKQVRFNMTVFWRWTSLSNWHLLLVYKQTRRLWNTKSKSYFNMTLFEGGSQCQTKNRLPNQLISIHRLLRKCVTFVTVQNYIYLHIICIYKLEGVVTAAAAGTNFFWIWTRATTTTTPLWYVVLPPFRPSDFPSFRLCLSFFPSLLLPFMSILPSFLLDSYCIDISYWNAS